MEFPLSKWDCHFVPYYPDFMKLAYRIKQINQHWPHISNKKGKNPMINFFFELREKDVYCLLVYFNQSFSFEDGWNLYEHFHLSGKSVWSLNRSFLKILFLEN